MDELGLITLEQELLADIHVAAHACRRVSAMPVLS